MVRAFHKYLYISLFVFSFYSFHAAAKVIRLSEPIERDTNSETFGNVLEKHPKATLTQLLADPEQHIERYRTIETTVAKVCQKKGCFFIAYEGKKSIRVSFKDYSFFVPTDIARRKVVMNAQLVKRRISQKEADHLNNDLAQDASIRAFSSGDVYELVASSVKVQDHQ